MYCKKCKYTSFDHFEHCPKCGRNWQKEKELFGLNWLNFAPGFFQVKDKKEQTNNDQEMEIELNLNVETTQEPAGKSNLKTTDASQQIKEIKPETTLEPEPEKTTSKEEIEISFSPESLSADLFQAHIEPITDENQASTSNEQTSSSESAPAIQEINTNIETDSKDKEQINDLLEDLEQMEVLLKTNKNNLDQ
ncbi:MAG: hypothetical protein Q9M37_08005 [Desulfonauticus sp.]|nr:hypothetical protein [Desulfonauticus sp.]